MVQNLSTHMSGRVAADGARVEIDGATVDVDATSLHAEDIRCQFNAALKWVRWRSRAICCSRSAQARVKARKSATRHFNGAMDEMSRRVQKASAYIIILKIK